MRFKNSKVKLEANNSKKMSKSPNKKIQIEELKSSIDLKRRELQNEFKTASRAQDLNLIRHVHFDDESSIDLENRNSESKPENNKSPPLFSTYTIRIDTKAAKLNQENKKSPLSTSKIPLSNKINDSQRKIASTNKSPLKQTTNTIKVASLRPVITYQQKKLIEQERKAQFDKNLEIVRRKIIARKFGYIWLRKFFYKTKKTPSLPLLSQAE
jgi:hypothetical protein